MKSVAPSPEALAARDDVLETLKRHQEKLSAVQILAIISHLVGQVLAMQDQRTMTPDGGMRIVAANIEAGNAEAIAALCKSAGNA